jgi:GrpB-like predicted nucleotidyltransferase (UPF0157 family)
MSKAGETILVGGVERRAIEILEHDPAWSVRFAQLRGPLVEALAGVAVRVEHVGSTAVPGLAAKPIVDVQVAVEHPDREQDFGSALTALGYEIRVREPAHRMFRTSVRDVHVHVWRADSDDERRHLLLRDWLRRTPADREHYAEVKRALARRQWEDMNAYSAAKADVIAEILERAERWAAASGWSLPAPLAVH